MASLAATLASSLVVLAHGDLFAVDVASARWYRLTRTYGAVRGAIAGAHELAYATKKGIGIVDLAQVKTSRAVSVGALPVLGATSGDDVLVGRPWKQLDGDGKLHPT